MSRIRHPHTPEPTPPEGIVEMVCTLFVDDPEQMQAYAVFAARVDHYLHHHGLRDWSMLDAYQFVAHSARSRDEAITLCCMLATVLPWLVQAGDLTSLEASAICRAISEACPSDEDARVCIEASWEQIGEAARLRSVN